MTTSDAGPENLSETVFDRVAHEQTFREDILEGLSRQNKSIPAKHLYDARGSEMFNRICEVDDYYVTRTERAIYEEHLPSIARRLGRGVVLIEPGSGHPEKAELILGALEDPAAYVPIEISHSAVEEAGEHLAMRFPDVAFHPICADFTQPIDLPDELESDRRVVFFPGSTIGNFEPPQRLEILKRFARLAGKGGALLIGFDLIKDPDVLLAAYDDSEGVTEEFNTNLLERINRELDGDIDVDAFEYEARWNDERSRIEMGQVSAADQSVTVAGERFGFRKGERLHVENSYKFRPEDMIAEAARAGFQHVEHWTDPRRWFCVALFRIA